MRLIPRAGLLGGVRRRDLPRRATRRGGAIALVAVGALALSGLTAPAGASPAQASGLLAPTAIGAARHLSLTNLDHLDWLGATVTPPEQAGHTTYQLDQDPSLGTLWTYADRNDDGTYRRVGGGAYDEVTDTWGQGAFNADDMTRAAVVYLRHWHATGAQSSRDRAEQMLRGVAYMQTVDGPDAGNVVLWMQPDGTLNPSAEPVELPDPSDSDASYWLARTIWALGEGYAAFREVDPDFAAFLADRLDLAVAAVDRQVLDKYGEYLNIDGQRTPAWLIADGADASAEAVLGLSSYVDAGGPASARRALTQLSRGIAQLSQGDARHWMFGGIRPWALSRSVWHAWGTQMPAALSRASVTLGRPGLARVASADSFTFDPWMLTSGGPDNGRLPTRGDMSQIAYGADSRLQSLVATADATDRPAGRDLAGMVAAWFFGANPAGAPMYDPETGRTFDGISAEGVINRNSGAESTMHGLLSMILLDEHPRIEEAARTATIERRVGATTLEAEDASLRGGAEVVVLDSLWTGESLFGGTGYAAVDDRGSVRFRIPRGPRSAVLPVVDLQPGSTGVLTFRSRGRSLGTVDTGDVGPQGDSPAPGALLPRTLDRNLAANALHLTASARRVAGGEPARLDSVMLQPLISRLVLVGGGHASALVQNVSYETRSPRVRLSGQGPVRVTSYDGQGRIVDRALGRGRVVRVTVPAGGFALALR